MPEEHWAEVGPFVRAVVSAVENQTAYTARGLLSVVAAHVYWCWHIAGVPLEIKYVFRHEVIAQFTYSLTGVTNATRGSYRSRLLRVADALADGPGAQITFRPHPMPSGDPSKPYTPAQQFLLRGWAEHQRTENLRVNARVLLSCSLGAGLSTSEVLRLEAGHIEVDEHGVLLRVVGERARTVPVLAQWEDDLVAIAEASWRPDAYVFLPRRNMVNPHTLYNFIHRSGAKPFDINVQRLRATWIVTHLNAGTPIQALLSAAGIETLKAIGRFLEFASDIDPDVARHAMIQRARNEGCQAPLANPTRTAARRQRRLELAASREVSPDEGHDVGTDGDDS